MRTSSLEIVVGTLDILEPTPGILDYPGEEIS
jgi:hypothetical protein